MKTLDLLKGFRDDIIEEFTAMEMGLEQGIKKLEASGHHFAMLPTYHLALKDVRSRLAKVRSAERTARTKAKTR